MSLLIWSAKLELKPNGHNMFGAISTVQFWCFQEQSVMYMFLSGKFMIMKKKHQCQRRKERVSIRHHAQCQPCFHPRYQSRRTEAAGFWSCVENVFCKVAAPHRYIGNILDQHVNVMQKYLEVAPNRRVQKTYGTMGSWPCLSWMTSTRSRTRIKIHQ